MKRTGRLKTYKPIERRTPLRQVSGLKTSAMKQKRPMPAVPVDVREALRVRAGEGFWCEAQLEGCQGQGIDPHHRITRGAGGRHREAKERSDRMSALLLLCRACHRWTHEHPAAAEPLGLLLPQSAIPAQVPVLYRGEPKYLDDAGGVWSLEEVGA